VQLRPGPAGQRAEHPGAFLTQGNQRPVPGRIRTGSRAPLLHEPAACRKPAPGRRARVSAKVRRPWPGHLVLYGCADGPAEPASLEWAGQPVLHAAAGLLAGRNRRAYQADLARRAVRNETTVRDGRGAGSAVDCASGLSGGCVRPSDGR
jgi:hypothetical protein